MNTARASKVRGLLLHSKHAFMPNNLGYCGPDDRGRILEHLEEGKGGSELISTLKRFESAYPFLALIARGTGRGVYDYSVPEAYWIGNSLLEQVPVPEFYSFSHRVLKGRDPHEVSRIFRKVGPSARPHHTYFVMSTFAGSAVKGGSNLLNDDARKVVQSIDSCRVSWGRVKRVEKKDLVVEYRPLALNDGRFALSEPVLKRIQYNPEVHPFEGVKERDKVSIHWNYACEVLTPRQAKSIARYTALDIASVNALLAE